MTVNIEKIYRVVCDDNYQRTTPHIAKTIAKHFYELGFKAGKEE